MPRYADGDKLFASESRIGSANSYTEVEPDGTLLMVGDAKVYEDLRIPITSTKTGGSKDPQFTVFKTDGLGSQGVFLYWFDKATEEELYFICQMPHSWDGGAIEPHIHWTPSTNADGNPVAQKVVWGLEYSWANIGSLFGDTSIITEEAHLPLDANVVAGKHYITSLPLITPTADQNGLSSILACRVFRDATAVADTYEHDVGLIEIDFHFALDTLGSRQLYVK